MKTENESTLTLFAPDEGRSVNPRAAEIERARMVAEAARSQGEDDAQEAAGRLKCICCGYWQTSETIRDVPYVGPVCDACQDA